MTTRLEEALSGVQHRTFQVRATDTEKREVEGIAVPWGQVADLGWFTEEVQRGAVNADSSGAQLWWRHTEPIGRVVFSEDQDGGWFIRAKISETARGDEAMTLLRDGVIDQFSIGFETIAYEVREDGPTTHIVQTEIHVREVSLVPLPAYEGAQVSNVRTGDNRKKETPMPERENTTPEDQTQAILELRELVGDLERRFGAQITIGVDHTPQIDTRSAGAILKSIAGGDQDTIEIVNGIMERAYTGGTTADTVMKNSWVGDLTRIVDDAAPLIGLFSTGDLPEKGNVIEFGRLKSNTVVVTKQVNEGDDLPYGRVQVETDTAKVETYGGYGELSRQVIERGTVNLLDTLLLAQAIATGNAMDAEIRALYVTIHAAQVAANNTVTIPSTGADYQDWINALVDAALKFKKLGLPITGLLVNAVVFKELGGITAEDGRPVLLIRGDGNNNIGTFNPSGLTGDLAGCTIVLDAGDAITQADGPDVGTELDVLRRAAFVNKLAIRSYMDPLVRLQDENIINLTKQYSVYRYAAFADEYPQAIVPVVFGA